MVVFIQQSVRESLCSQVVSIHLIVRLLVPIGWTSFELAQSLIYVTYSYLSLFSTKMFSLDFKGILKMIFVFKKSHILLILIVFSKQ